MASTTNLTNGMTALNMLNSKDMSTTDGIEHASAHIDFDTTNSLTYWVDLISTNLRIAHSNQGSDSEPEDELQLLNIDEAIMSAPRRRSARGPLAEAFAAQLYPTLNDSLAAIIRYEKDIVMLRSLVRAQRRSAINRATERYARVNWIKRISKQGPWDEVEDPLSTAGALSLPMPVEVSDKESLVPFFAHLRNGGTHATASPPAAAAEAGVEPYYNVELIEFEKGVLYSDGRVDLCKMVTGPRNIGDLMESLKPNTFSKHFLLGNNIIGPTGAKAIASFIDEYPERFETWYLAGNCIDAASLTLLVDNMVKSPAITNIWLKRNPLGPAAAEDVFRLLIKTPNLRTLDLDQTELSDDGVAELFTLLAEHKTEKPLALRHIYLNATGAGSKACKAISNYLASPSCTLASLFMSSNPIGDNVAHLAPGLKANATLERISLQSCGLKDKATMTLLEALHGHPTLQVLDLGQAYATEDLGMRFNWLTNSTALAEIIKITPLRYLNISYTPMVQTDLNRLVAAVADSASLLYFQAKPLTRGEKDANSVHAGQEFSRLHKLSRQRLHANVMEKYGICYERFEQEEKRFLVSPRDVRLIDSVYRNRDAGLARRGLKKLNKSWIEGDETLKGVQDGTLI